MNLRLVVIGAVALSLFTAAGFALGRASAQRASGQPGPAGAPGTVVARWSGGELTAEQLRERVFAQKLAAGLPALDAASSRSFADAAIRSAVLATEARRLGLERDPKVSGQTADVLSRRLVELQFEDGSKHAPASEAAVKSWYDQHRSEFVRPERVRLSTVELATPAGDPAGRKKLQQELEGFRSQLLAMAPGAAAAAFTARAKAQLDSLTRPELEAKLGAQPAQQVWLMVGLGQLSEVVQTDAGVQLFRLEGREGALDVSLESARAQIESRLWYARRDAELNQFVTALGTRLGLAVDQAELDKLLAELR